MLAGLNPYYGHAVKDHPLLAIGKMRFVGEPVAAVIAEDELSAQEAAKKWSSNTKNCTHARRGCGVEPRSGENPRQTDYRAGNFRGFDDQSIEI